MKPQAFGLGVVVDTSKVMTVDRTTQSFTTGLTVTRVCIHKSKVYPVTIKFQLKIFYPDVDIIITQGFKTKENHG